jgi:hypothetical protein
MPLSHLPDFLTTAFAALTHWLDKRSAARLPLLLLGILFAKGRRTITSWLRAAGITDAYRPAFCTVRSVGRHADDMAVSILATVKPLLGQGRLLVAIDDTPTPRDGPLVEGAGIHHNPCPGPAGNRHLYGHVWVTLAALVRHLQWGSTALPLQARLYIRSDDLKKLPPQRLRPFRTRLELAVELLDWLQNWAGDRFARRWVVADGAYARRVLLRGAKRHGFTVLSRLRKDAALWSVPVPVPRHKRGRGRPPTYGKRRISLAKRAGQKRGWQQVRCVQYGKEVIKSIKTFTATGRPAGGLIRVVLVKEENDWLPLFCVDAQASVVEILEAAADRGAIEQTFKEAKQVWGAGQQQVRNAFSSEGCFNLNLWMYSLIEVWSWGKPEAELVDRSRSPWDSEPRRPSHQDKRKSLQREVLQGEIREALSGRPTRQKMRELAQRLLDLAA